MKFSPIFAACFLICTGYGITFSLFSFLVNATGVSGKWIGINAALPAIGWILGSLLVPYLQLKRQISIKKIALWFLVLAGVGCCIPLVSDGYLGISLTRLVFGGAIGVFLRCVEYILVANAPQDGRGRYLAMYGVTFLVGIIIGSSIQPALGTEISLNITIVLALMTLGGLIFAMAKVDDSAWTAPQLGFSALALVPALPVAFIGVVAYALYESVPAYLLQIFALRSGLDDTIAAYTLPAAALGNLILLFPLLLLSDKLGRQRILGICAAITVLVPFAIPNSVDAPALFLGLIAILGAAAGTSYALSLAMLGDHFKGQALVMANALFGVFYAIGSVVGPLFHGLAMEFQGPNGLMNSVSGIFLCLFLGIVFVAVSGQIRGRHV